MSSKKVLVFGITGIEKNASLNRFKNWCKNYKTRECKVVDFEKEFLFNEAKGGISWYNFLNNSQEEQLNDWEKAWKRFTEDENFNNLEEDLFVGLHGCVVRGHYGVRSIVRVSALEEFNPDCIITLIDDVYDMWWRTEKRAKGEDYRGRPTFEQLLFARRTELIIADQIRHSRSLPTPHFMLSVSHPCETLANFIYTEQKKIVYLCFPISAPRDLIINDDTEGKQEIITFLKMAYSYQSKNPNLVVTCPLGIDELPIASVANEKKDRILFDREKYRWAMDEIWDSKTILSPSPPDREDRCEIPMKQLRDAIGMINTDVGWRDFRLVGQANYLAVFNPKFKNRDHVSRSVNQEIHFAITNGTPCYVFQDKKHDPQNIFKNSFLPSGTMPQGPGQQLVILKNSIDEVFSSILN